MTATHFDLNEVRAAAHKLAEHRREARRDYERYGEQAADADRDYRKHLAIAFAKAKSKDQTATQAEVEAHAEAADDKHRRAMAEVMMKSALLRIEELEADRAILNRLSEWSMRLEGLPQPQWTPKEAA